MVDFIRTNPYTEARRRGLEAADLSATRQLANETGQFKLNEARRAADQARAADAAMGRALGGGEAPKASPAGGGSGLRNVTSVPKQFQSPVAGGGAGQPASIGTGLRGRLATELAGVPGARASAAKFALDNEGAEIAAADKIFKLAEENPDMAEAYAARMGRALPPGFQAILRNSRARQEMSRIFDDAKALYGDDARMTRTKAEWIKLRMRDALSRGLAVPQAAADAPLPPQVPVTKPGFRPVTTIGADGKPTVGRLNTATGEVTQTDVPAYVRPGKGAVDEQRGLYSLAKQMTEADPRIYVKENGAYKYDFLGKPIPDPNAYGEVFRENLKRLGGAGSVGASASTDGLRPIGDLYIPDHVPPQAVELLLSDRSLEKDFVEKYGQAALDHVNAAVGYTRR